MKRSNARFGARGWLAPYFICVSAGIAGPLASTGPASAQGVQEVAPKPTQVGDREADKEAIRQSARDFSAAFEKGDAKAVAALWTETGEYHDDTGVAIRGRADLEKAYADHFKTRPKGKVEVEIISIHFPSRDTAIEEGVLRARPAGATLPTSTRYSVLHVREDGKWKIAASREWGADASKLDDLHWLVGSWSAKSKDREVQMKFEWNASKTMIRNSFTAKEGGKITASGIQMIGLDPQTGRIRSFLFDEEGGRGESLWFREGSSWVLDSVGVLPGAGDTSAVNLITRINDDKFTWRSIHRTIGIHGVPDTAPVTVSRVKSAN